MAIDGTKKRGIFGKFSGYPAGKSKPSVEKASGYSRLGKTKSGMKSPRSRPGNKSVDETENDTFPGDVSSASEKSSSKGDEVQSRASSMSTTPPELTRFQSPITLAEFLDMPIPPPVPLAPITTMSSGPDHHRSLPTKKLMLKLRRKEKKEYARPVISAPILQGPGPRMRTRPIIPDPSLQGPGPVIRTRSNISASMSQVPSLSQTDMPHDDDVAPPEGATTPQISTADAEFMNQKIDSLLNKRPQAFQAAEDPQAKANVNTGKMSRRSPLQRGKAALAKATRAMGVRMNSNGRNGLGEQAVHEPEEGAPPSSSLHDLPKSGSNDNPDSPTRIALRKAEGTNLAKTKVQALMGDGFIKRKPLPGAEKQRSPTSEMEDPLADAKLDAILAHDTPGFSGSNSNFGPNGAQHNSSHSPSSSQTRSEISMSIAAGGRRPHSKSRSTSSNDLSYLKYSTETESFSTSPVECSTPLGSSSPFGYLDTVSSPAQHADNLTFPSFPAHVSPPRVHLKRTHTSIRRKRSGAVFKRDSSITNIGFENAIRDDAPFVATHSGPSPNRSTSIRRKTAKVEQRHNVSTLKRTKRVSFRSNNLREEAAGLVTDIGRLGTEDRQTLLRRYQNTEIGPREKGAPNRGLAIFDVPKVKETMMSEDDERPRPPLRRAVNQRSAIPRPTADFYSSRMREREAALDTTVNNPMHVVKMQKAERAYRVGKKH